MPKHPDDPPREEKKAITQLDRLQEGWEPAPIVINPTDGMPGIKAADLINDEGERPPTLCEHGQCVRYHEVEMQMDVAQPMDGSLGDLKGYVVRSCYPVSGVEFALTTPIWRCNRFEPNDAAKQRHGTENRFGGTIDATAADVVAGFRTVLEAWRDKELRRREEEARQLELALSDEPPPDGEWTLADGTKVPRSTPFQVRFSIGLNNGVFWHDDGLDRLEADYQTIRDHIKAQIQDVSVDDLKGITVSVNIALLTGGDDQITDDEGKVIGCMPPEERYFNHFSFVF